MKIMMYKPARQQVTQDELPSDRPPQTGNVYNVWYLRWSGGDGSQQFVKLNYRVDISRDCGYTRANKAKIPTSTICLYFSKGCCYRGKDCQYLHRLPTEDDYYPPTQDCFGRDKTFTHRDDMDGVGVLNKINDTLYVGGLHTAKNMESVLSKHFGEFGKILKIKLLGGKNCAFITYKNEFEAQFAKEAMQNQSLDGDEILSVKWANDDPDPVSHEERKRKLEEMTINTVRNLLAQNNTNHTEYEVEEPELDYDGELQHDHGLENEDTQENPPRKQQKLIQDTFFDKDTLHILSSLRKTKHKVEKIPATIALGYSSDED